jgi:hypothetical protein
VRPSNALLAGSFPRRCPSHLLAARVWGPLGFLLGRTHDPNKSHPRAFSSILGVLITILVLDLNPHLRTGEININTLNVNSKKEAP